MLTGLMLFQAPIFDSIVAYGIGGLAIIIALLWVWIFGADYLQKRIFSRVFLLGMGAALVMGISAWVASRGWLLDFTSKPPPMLLLLGSIISVAAGIGLSRIGKMTAHTQPFWILVLLQSFRLPLEILMHRAAQLGIMPVEMSYSGYNFDIFTGLGALLLGLYLRTQTDPTHISPNISPNTQRWIWVWNIYGMTALLAVVSIALLSSPLLHIFGTEPAHVNTWVLYFPYIWLPSVLVTVALMGHIVITRKLLHIYTAA